MSAFGRVFGVLLRWRSPTGQATAWVVALIGPAAVAAATESYRASLGLTGFLFFALLVVVVVALVGGRRPALAAVVVGSLAAAYAFTAPYNTFRLYARPEDAPLVVFIVVGAAVAILIDALAQLLEEQTSLRRVESAVRRVATLVARAASAEEVFAAATEEVGGLLTVDLAGMGRFDADGTVTILAGWRSDGERLPVGSRAAVEDGNLSALVAATGRPARIDSPSDASHSVGALLRGAGIRSAVAVPITVQARLWGVMIAGSTGPMPLPTDTEAQLVDFTELLATAVSNAESNAWLARLAEEQAALRRIATLVARGVPQEEVFAAVAEEVVRLLGTDSAIMGRYESDGALLSVARSGGPPEEFPVGSRYALGGKNLGTIVFETGRPARIDRYVDSGSGPIGVSARDANIRSSVGTPIVVEGRLWGLIAAGTTLDTQLPADAEARLGSFTELVATAIANAESRAGLALLAEEQAALRHVATLVAGGTPQDELFAAVTDEVGRLLSAEYVHLIRYERDEMATSLAAFGRTEGTLPAGTRLKLGGNNVTTLVSETRRSVRIDDYGNASGPFADGARERNARLQSSVGMPIVVEAKLWGVVVVGCSEEQSLPADTEARLASFTELVATAIANTESRAGLAHLAEEQEALRRVATLVARGVPQEELFASVIQEVKRLLLPDVANLCRFESDSTFTVVAAASELFEVGSRWPIGGRNVATLVFETGRSGRLDNYVATGPEADDTRGEVRSGIGTPIIVEGHLWGMVGVARTRDTPLSPDTEARLAGFTGLVATAIANAESRADLARLAEEQEALRRVATLVARGVPQEELFASVTEEVAQLLHSDLANLTSFESDRTFTILASAHERFPVGSRWPIGGKNVTTAVFETRRPARIDNFIYTGPLAHDIHGEIRSAVGSPIMVEGRLWGAIGLGSAGEQALPPDIEERLAAFTDLVAMAIANAQSRAALRPVERMRSQAEQITERELSARLPVADDTGEVTALGRTLNAMLDRVEEAVARERRVVSDASHELRTPLTTLRAEVDLALMGDRDKAELRAALESASEEAKRMSRLADDLLVLARADQGRLPIHPQPLAARELLEDAAGRAHAGAEVRGRALVIAELSDDCAVRADPDRAAQALDNLITNALLYGKGTITLSAQSNHQHVALHVADEGDGFPSELLPRAFERFGRGQHARSTEPGSGLGLALVEAVAVAHGGEAEARNRPGGGADVSIALPRA